MKNEEEKAARRSDARAAYDEVCGELDFVDWQESEETGTEAIVRHGLYSDAVVLERLSNDEGPEALTLDTALFETPGPVLVTPPKAPAAVGGSVAVVWSPTVQSARAVRSALPILRKADSVTTITNSAKTEADSSALVDYLDAHGWRVLSARSRARVNSSSDSQRGSKRPIARYTSSG